MKKRAEKSVCVSMSETPARAELPGCELFVSRAGDSAAFRKRPLWGGDKVTKSGSATASKARTTILDDVVGAGWFFGAAIPGYSPLPPMVD